MRDSEALIAYYWAKPIVLRESIRARISAAPLSILNTVITILLYLPFLLQYNVSHFRIALWAVPIFLLIAARAVFSSSISIRLDDFSNLEMLRADQILRLSSIINQTTVGMGIWIIGSPAKDDLVLPIFMTMVVVSWSIGVITNLFSDFRSFVLSMPLMIATNAAFWIAHGGVGISIGLSLLLTISLMMMLVRRGSTNFRESILMRFEKDQLLKRVEEEHLKTEQALREAQRASYAKDYFMAAAKHDVKQPLHALALLTETLLMSDPPDSHIPLLKQQRASIAQMSDHFDALMDMRSFLSGKFELHVGKIRLSDFRTRIDSEIAPACARKGLNWRLDMDDALVSSDEELLLRLFRNLLTNAVRYTDQGEVRCSAKADGNIIKVLISDTGIGIAPEYQELVFEDFVRLKIESMEPTGSGLGLSIVKKISQALQLDLQMSSSTGRGTQFSFWLSIAGKS